LNAALIQYLMKNSNHADPSSIQVRLVVDHGGGQRDPMVVVSLAQAAQTAVDLDLDLMGIQLKQDPPVLRAQSMQKLKYKEQSAPTTTSKSLPVKEIKFKAGIADHDLERKATQIVGYLDKGHPCQVTLQASQFKLKQDADVLQTTLSRVVAIVGDSGEIAGKMKLGREGGLMTMMLVPPSKESKNKAKKRQRQEVKEATDQETPPSQVPL
jgi:translation initiation factor IF-3